VKNVNLQPNLSDFKNKSDMKRVVIFICFCLCLSCKKEQSVGKCVGCDFKPYTEKFTIKGQLFDKCAGQPAANKRLQGFLLNKSDNADTLTVTSNANGQFEMTYSYTFNAYTRPPINALPPFAIRLVEDSALFYISPTTNFPNLTLNLKDSIRCTINTDIAPNSRAFTNLDTLVYYFEGVPNTPTLGITTKSFKKAGPFTKGSIGVVNSPLKIIRINDDGRYNVVFVWDIITPTSYSNSSADKALASKVPCLMRNDSVLLTLLR
jgi:hypothetical protein